MKFRILTINVQNRLRQLGACALLSFCACLLPVYAADTPPDLTTFDHLATGFPLDGEHENLACEQCHLGGVFDTLPKECNQCHDNVFAIGQPVTHIPTAAPCETCHTPVGFTISAQALFDHGSVSGLRCDSCHNGVNATGKPPNHILTTSDCGACHTISSWFVDVFNHTDYEPITSCTAAGCHTASEKPPTHPSTTNNCRACHNYTGWRPYIRPLDHNEVLGNCGNSGCHDGTGPGQGKPPTHPLTSNTCGICHTFPDWSALNSPFDHAGVMEPSCNRAGCHSVSDQPLTHPLVSSTRCELCHTSMGSWIVDPNFDHDLTPLVTCSTGNGCHTENDKRPGHPSVISNDCNVCHSIKGQWLPLASPFDHSQTSEALCTASGCHSSTDKGANHPPTTNMCSACHDNSNNAWLPVVLPFDHNEINTTNCTTAGCHSVADKTATHPITSDTCEACHSAGSWSPLPQIDHTQALDSCVSCHNGTAARGKGATHPQTSDACDECHNTNTWTQVTNIHSDPLNAVNCSRAGCHDGVAATGKSGNHPNTTNTCEACHSYNVWRNLNNPIDHGQTSELCEVCHNNVIATGKSATHFPTIFPCDSCHHSTSTWLGAVFDHSTVANLACASAGCHDGVPGGPTDKSPTHPITSNLCDACHTTNNWTPRNPIDHGETTDLCSNCHNNTIANGKPGNHCPTSLECDQCHTTSGWRQILNNAPACNGTAPPPGTTPPPPSGSNQLPVAIISAPGTSGFCNTVYRFDGSGSYDPENQTLNYQWWVLPAGSGTIATPWQPATNITFTSTGQKTIRLIVNDGTQDSLPAEVTFNVSGMCM